MICEKCGNKNVEISNFCSKCGSQLIKEEKQKSKENMVSKLKKKVNVKELQFSAKMGYYTRIPVFIYLCIICIIALIFIVNTIFYVVNPTIGDSDSRGYSLLGLFLLGPFVLGIIFGYISILNILGVVLPSTWIDKKEKVPTWVEVLRIIDLLVCYILILIPIVALIISILN